METNLSENKTQQVLHALKEVIDPEIGINVVDLGLIYRVEYDDLTGIEVDYTLTTEGCPMSETIHLMIKETLYINFPGLPVRANVIWEPVWTPERISNEGKHLLGMV